MANLWLPARSKLAKAARGWPGPGEKPTGPLKVKSEWLAKGLQSAWVFGPDGAKEIAFNRKATVSNVNFGSDYLEAS